MNREVLNRWCKAKSDKGDVLEQESILDAWCRGKRKDKFFTGYRPKFYFRTEENKEALINLARNKSSCEREGQA